MSAVGCNYLAISLSRSISTETKLNSPAAKRGTIFNNGPSSRWLREQAVGVLLALIIVIAVTVSLMAASLWLPIEHVTIVYLIPVIVAALRWGAIPALCAGISGLAAPAYFFYAPIYDFRVHSPAQIVDMIGEGRKSRQTRRDIAAGKWLGPHEFFPYYAKPASSK